MKAKIRSTGEIVDVSPSGVTSVQRACTKYATKDGRELLDLALEFLPNIDWEQRRYEIAKEAMNGLLSTSIMDTNDPKQVLEYTAMFSVWFADALIEELKGGEK